MLTKESVELMHRHFQRIFATKVNRSTFREVQNVILIIGKNDEDLANKILQCIAKQEVDDSICEKEANSDLQKFLDEFSILVRFSREVQERGDLVSIITTDLLQQNKLVGFLHRIKRIDGEEFHFITDEGSTFNLFHHFFIRLQELDQQDKSKEAFSQQTALLKNINEQLSKLIAKHDGDSGAKKKK